MRIAESDLRVPGAMLNVPSSEVMSSELESAAIQVRNLAVLMRLVTKAQEGNEPSA